MNDDNDREDIHEEDGYDSEGGEMPPELDAIAAGYTIDDLFEKTNEKSVEDFMDRQIKVLCTYISHEDPMLR